MLAFTSHRSLRFPAASSALLLSLVVGCAGEVAPTENPPAADAGSEAAPAASPSAAPSSTPSAAPSSTPSVPLPPPNSALDQPLSVSDCASRPFYSYPSSGGTTAYALVEGWLAPMIAECQAAAPRSCGQLTVHFSRSPEPACADDLRFTQPPSPAFVQCMTNALAKERNGAGVVPHGFSPPAPQPPS